MVTGSTPVSSGDRNAPEVDGVGKANRISTRTRWAWTLAILAVGCHRPGATPEAQKVPLSAPTKPKSCEAPWALQQVEDFERQGMLRRAWLALAAAEQRCETVGLTVPELEPRRNELEASLLSDALPEQLVARAFAESDPAEAQRWWDRARTAIALETKCYGELRAARLGQEGNSLWSADGSLWMVPIVVLPNAEKRLGMFGRRPDGTSGILKTLPEKARMLFLDANGYVFQHDERTHIVRVGSARQNPKHEIHQELTFGDASDQLDAMALVTPSHLDGPSRLRVLDWPALTPRFSKVYDSSIAVEWVGPNRLLVEVGDGPTVDTLADGKLEYHLLDASSGGALLSGKAGFVGTDVDQGWLIRGLFAKDWLVEIYSLRDGRKLRSTHVPIANPVVGWRIGWEPAPGGQLLLTTGGDLVHILDVQTGARRELETQHHEIGLSGSMGRIGVARDGRHFCQHAHDLDAPCDVDWAVDFMTGEKALRTRDGRRYACYAAKDDFVAVAHAEYPGGALTGPDRRRVCNQYIRSNASQVDPQGTRLALLEVEAKTKLPAIPSLVIADVATGKVLHDIALLAPISDNPYITFSRDGRYVAVLYNQQSHIVDVASGNIVVPRRFDDPQFASWSPSRVFVNHAYREDTDIIELPLEHPLVGVQGLAIHEAFLRIPEAGDAGWDLSSGRSSRQPEPSPSGPSHVTFEPTQWGSLELRAREPAEGRATFVPLSATGAVAFYPGGNAELMGDATIESAGLFCDFCGTAVPAQVCQDEQLVHDAYERALRGEHVSGFARLRPE